MTHDSPELPYWAAATVAADRLIEAIADQDVGAAYGALANVEGELDSITELEDKNDG